MPDRGIPYHPLIIAQGCDRCKVSSPNRCQSPSGTMGTPPHLPRITAAGLRWNKACKRYEKLES